MQNQSKFIRTKFSRILCAITVALICASPCGALDIPTGTTVNLSTSITDFVNVYGTLNMYPGAYVAYGIYAFSGSAVNIYGGSIGIWAAISVSNGASVTVYGTGFSTDGTPLDYGEWTPPGGSAVLNGTYENGGPINLLFNSSIAINLVNTAGGGPEEITIDIKPGSYPNTINLGSNGVVPVAILSTADFDATALDPTTVFLAGSGVAVRGKGNSLAHGEDVNADGFMDLVVQVETENLDPGTFQDGWAILEVIENPDAPRDEWVALYEGWDEITIVPPQ